jgi:hypothetical protein
VAGRSVAGTAAPVVTSITNLQVFDNVTHVRGSHTFKAGASLTLRSRELLQADSPNGTFGFSVLPTSNCAGRLTGCAPNVVSTGLAEASFLLGYATQAARSYIGGEPYKETRPEWAIYVQDDFRATPRLTLNLGLRWDLFVPWVEEHDRQSNFDPTTGRFVVASEDATCRRTGRAISGRGSASPTTCSAAAGPSSAAASASSGTTAPAEPPRQKGRTRRFSGHKPSTHSSGPM